LRGFQHLWRVQPTNAPTPIRIDCAKLGAGNGPVKNAQQFLGCLTHGQVRQWYAEIHAFEHKMETKSAKAYDRLEAALEKEFDRVRRTRPLRRAKIRDRSSVVIAIAP
jgi:hypothetical protein